MERRLNFVFVLFLLFCGIILTRLFYWQVTLNERFRGLAEKQGLATLPIKAVRGKILASDGSSLVINQRAFGVFLEPKKINDQTLVTTALAKELGIPTASISARLKDTSLLWIPIAHRVEEEQVTAIKKYKLLGVEFIEEWKRYYPEASMAAHILGFVGKNSQGEDQGYFGLEGYYNEQLRGRDGLLRQEIDAAGNPIVSDKRENIPSENGRDLTLYLDKTIQYIVESKLKQGIAKYSAKGGTVIVMDPATGGILAMVSFPSYDPNEFYKYPAEFYKSPAISLSYEPGSTFKVLIMAAALNEGVVTSETKYNEEGPIEIGGYTIKTWNQKYHGEITLTQILEYSSNVGMVFVLGKLDRSKFLTYLDNLGFGSKTSVDLQEEAMPQLRPKNKWYEIDYATTAFGQGIAMTPFQLIRAVAAIANGGRCIEPHVVKSISIPNGETINISPKVVRKVFRPEISRLVTEMMVSAVDNGETRFIKPAGYRIAGKTGTAQIPISGHYDTEKTIASFVGFAPVEAPKFIMLVTLLEPEVSPWGSETAAPIFFEIAKELFSYFGISPSD